MDPSREAQDLNLTEADTKVGDLVSPGAPSREQESPEERLKRENQESFDRYVRGKFDIVPGGGYRSKLEGITSVTIGQIQEPTAEHAQQLYTTLFYNDPEGKEQHFTLAIGKEGNFMGRIPKDVHHTRPEIAHDTLETLREIGVGFWKLTDYEVLPDPGVFRERRTPGGEGKRPRIDPERLGFLIRQPNALFGIANRNKGFEGYRVTFFDTGAVLENETVGNAAFVVRFDAKATIPSERFNKPFDERLYPEEQDRFEEEYWKPIEKVAETRTELRNIGAKRVVHGSDTERWKSKILEALQAPEGDVSNEIAAAEG